MDKFLSVIVPVYQSESTIRRCVESVLTQSISNFELLLIDDGCTDRSVEICDEYARNDSRVKVFHKIHEGVSSARQIGVLNAIGEYSIHCDADDWMEPNMLELLYNKAQDTGADVVMCDVSVDYQQFSVVDKPSLKSMDSDTILRNLYEPLCCGLWNKLIRHSLYRKLNLVFAKEVEHAEDLYVLLQLYSHSVKTEYVPQTLYHYDKSSNASSLTNRMDVTCLVRSMPYFETLDQKTRPAVDKLKLYVLMRTYVEKTYPIDEWKRIYPEVQKKLLKAGLCHPISKWEYIEPGMVVYHCGWLGRIYTAIFTCLLMLKHKITQ